jgi:hypothetical protein
VRELLKMGYNRSGDRRKKRIQRHRKEMERLFKKAQKEASAQPTGPAEKK